MPPVYCNRCGTPNIDGAAFCSKCGVPVGPSPGGQPPGPLVASAVLAPAKGTTHPGSFGPVHALLVLGAIVVLAGGGFGIYALASKDAPAPAPAGPQAQPPPVSTPAAAAPAVQDPAETARLTAAEVARQTQRQSERDKAALLATPSRFLAPSDLMVDDKGIINHYRQLIRITVLNKSQFSVTGVHGEVDWVDAKGGKFGSTTFELAGSIPAGATEQFSVSSGTLKSTTIQGSGQPAIRFTSLNVVEAR